MYKKNIISTEFLKARHKKSLGLLDGMNPKSILDVGCDDGRFLIMLEREFPTARLSACDLNPVAVDYAKAACPKATIKKGDFMALDLKSVDLVTLLEVIEHAQNPKAMMAKARDLIENEGYILVSMPRPDLLRWQIIWKFWTNTVGKDGEKLGRKFYGEHTHLTETELENIASELGLRLEKRSRFFLGCVSIMLFKKSRG
jgi:2-polyprenyl-3-methyl-5-hydroxy-6-metoxy-1,4-benzoquinol methylase